MVLLGLDPTESKPLQPKRGNQCSIYESLPKRVRSRSQLGVSVSQKVLITAGSTRNPIDAMRHIAAFSRRISSFHPAALATFTILIWLLFRCIITRERRKRLFWGK